MPATADATEPVKAVLLSERVGPDHPGLAPAQFLIDRWHGERPAGGLPTRDAFLPETLGAMLGRVSLVEPVNGGSDHRYRVHAGTAANVAALDMTGRTVSEFPYPDFAQVLNAAYRDAVAERAPVRQRFRLCWFGTVYDYISVVLPLSDPSTGQDLLLSAVVHTDPNKTPYGRGFRPPLVERSE